MVYEPAKIWRTCAIVPLVAAMALGAGCGATSMQHAQMLDQGDVVVSGALRPNDVTEKYGSDEYNNTAELDTRVSVGLGGDVIASVHGAWSPRRTETTRSLYERANGSVGEQYRWTRWSVGVGAGWGHVLGEHYALLVNVDADVDSYRTYLLFGEEKQNPADTLAYRLSSTALFATHERARGWGWYAGPQINVSRYRMLVSCSNPVSICPPGSRDLLDYKDTSVWWDVVVGLRAWYKESGWGLQMEAVVRDIHGLTFVAGYKEPLIDPGHLMFGVVKRFD